MEINFYKGDKLIRTAKVDKYEFTIVAAHSNYFRRALRVLLELNVESKTGSFFLAEDLDNTNPGMNVQKAGFYVENFFFRTRGTLSRLVKSIKSENASTSI